MAGKKEEPAQTTADIVNEEEVDEGAIEGEPSSESSQKPAESASASGAQHAGSRKRANDDVDNDSESTKDEPSTTQEEESKRPRISTAQQRQRGQRMFGVLLGTLSKFKETNTKKTEAVGVISNPFFKVEIRREQLEQRLQEKLKKEQEEIAEKVRKDREEWKERNRIAKEEEDKKRQIQAKETVAAHLSHQARFLSTTTTKIPVFWLPAEHNDATRAALDKVWKSYLEQTEKDKAKEPVEEAVREEEAEGGEGNGIGLMVVDEEREGAVVGEAF
ncbi:hypothetical protein HDU97_002871 [Phlyctochytrium planicorne]|nr:hypothetical protein HDU97_002871 [Phlyctochytrium planicorne]